MCGIVAGISNKNVLPVLIEGLGRLEYRGYDSAGIAILNDKIQAYSIYWPSCLIKK